MIALSLVRWAWNCATWTSSSDETWKFRLQVSALVTAWPEESWLAGKILDWSLKE